MHADISAIAALIGDSTRAQMLWALMGGLARPAGELAMSANVAPQTASAHLSKLLEGKLVSAEVQGRHRYYRLASPEIAGVIEALATVAPRMKKPVGQEADEINPLAYARTCYTHLAGSLAVQINDVLQERGVLNPAPGKHYHITQEGRLWFKQLGIDVAHIQSNRNNNLARPCLDWTERRHHLAGALGTALLQSLFEKRWIARVDKTRAVRVTARGQDQLRKLFGIEFKH